MKSLTKCIDESCQQITSYMIDEAKAKGEVYKYEEAKTMILQSSKIEFSLLDMKESG